VESDREVPIPDPVEKPFYFRRQDLFSNPDPKNTIKGNRLINLWNSHHFMRTTVYVHVRHPDHKDDLLLEANPAPCSDGVMACRWTGKNTAFREKARILSVVFSDGHRLILVPVQLEDVFDEYFTLKIPENGYILGKRRARRYLCLRAVAAEVVQQGFRARGHLTDFSNAAFSVNVTPESPGSFRWFNPNNPSTVILYRNGHIVYSSSCRCIRQTADHEARCIVFAPREDKMNRFPKKKWRSPRVKITPIPNIAFDHPTIDKKVQIDIHDLSTSGFSVRLTGDEDVLMAGLIIPDMSINFAGALKIMCTAQILYRREDKKNMIRYGFAFLDMDVTNYNRLCHIVIGCIDPGTHVADEVDSDQLWEFLFESGFIYPEKYELLQAHRDPLKETYRRLYRDNPDILAQLTYQRNGNIYGHTSMVRSYRKTWMVHHLAARKLGNKRTGLKVLKQIMHYFNGLYRLPSVGMDYMMFYFRPENRFPDHFFGGFARHFNNPRACSLDLFSYLNYRKSKPGCSFPPGWSLGACSETDIDEIQRFYRNSSNGLLLDILHLREDEEERDSLSQMYARHGFFRSCESFSLKDNGILKAVIVVNRSDMGLSLSDFLNGMKILVADTEGLPWETLSTAVAELSGCYNLDKIPLLIYPFSYLEKKGIPEEKRYNLWILDGHYSQEYSDYMMENAKLRLRFILRLLVKRYLKR
jgi:hypothetical protein